MLSVLLACVSTVLAPAASVGEREFPFPDLALTLTLPAVDELAPGPPEELRDSLRGQWHGKLAGSDVRLRFTTLAMSEYGFVEPDDVVETWRESLRDDSKPDAEARELAFEFGPVTSVAAAVGCAPILATSRATLRVKSDPSRQGSLFLVGGLLPEHGWALRVDAWPALAPDVADKLAADLHGCAKYSGKPRDPRWTDEEALALWKSNAPADAQKKPAKVVRTEHYVVITNAPSPTGFVKKLEPWYASIARAMPYEPLPGRRLLPVLLFRTGNEYEVFHRAHHESAANEDVEEESFCDYGWVATSIDNDDDYELLLDFSKQFVDARLRAWGANLWLRSGLRECVASKPKERGETLRAIRKGKYTPLGKLLEDAAWDAEFDEQDKKGTTGEADYWEQAALWIEFLRDGPWPSGTFARFLSAVSGLADGDQAGVSAALSSVYGMQLDALQAKWVEHYSKP